MYDKSFHGNLVMNEGSKDAPACGDCHGSHGIIDPTSAEFRESIPEVCGRCHGEKSETYLDTYHGKSVLLGDISRAVCTDCHGYHEILPKSDPRQQRVLAERGRDLRQVPRQRQHQVLQLPRARRPQHAPARRCGCG